MHRLSKIIRIAVHAPIGFAAGLMELTQNGARQSFYRSRYPSVRFDWGVIADGSSDFEPPVTLLRGARIYESRVGRYTYLGRNSVIENAEIGRFCSIGPEVMIGLAAHPLGANVSTSPVFYKTRSKGVTPIFKGSTLLADSTFVIDEHRLVTIGHDVWIGARAIVKDGLSIGDGAVVAAGAVVTRDIPPYAIVAGVPARILRYRFDTETIEFLQQLRWWDQGNDWLEKHMCDFVDVCAVLNACT